MVAGLWLSAHGVLSWAPPRPLSTGCAVWPQSEWWVACGQGLVGLSHPLWGAGGPQGLALVRRPSDPALPSQVCASSVLWTWSP